MWKDVARQLLADVISALPDCAPCAWKIDVTALDTRVIVTLEVPSTVRLTIEVMS